MNVTFSTASVTAFMCTSLGCRHQHVNGHLSPKRIHRAAVINGAPPPLSSNLSEEH